MAGAAPHVMVLPFPAQGHVTPLMELSHRLVDHGFQVTFVCTEPIHKLLLDALRRNADDSEALDGIRLVSIPDGLADGDSRRDLGKVLAGVLGRVPGYVEELIRETEASGERKVRWLVADSTMACCYQAARNLGVRVASVCPASAACLVTSLRIPQLVRDGFFDDKGFPKRHGKIELAPGMPPLCPTQMAWNIDGAPEGRQAAFELVFGIAQVTGLAEIVMCNSFLEAETAAFELFPNVLPIGPLFADQELQKPVGQFWPEDTSCLEWLDAQPEGSVVYVAFGSFTIFDPWQFRELAEGLELTGRPFLWVVRPDFTSGGLSKAWFDEFQKRVAGNGMIVSWCPQQQVLAHRAVACFVSHCGWNSTMEGVRNGVPILCWPYFSDQFANRSYICDIWRTGLGVTHGEDGVVTKEEVKARLEQLTGDKGIAERARMLRDAARKSVNEGGSSYENFKRFVDLLTEAEGERPAMAKGHVLVLPMPCQGHVVPLMELSHRLVDHGFEVTFVNTDVDHALVLAAMVPDGGGEALRGIHLASIPDGLADDEDRKDLNKLVDAYPRHMPAYLEKLVGEMEAAGRPRVKWLVADFNMGWSFEVAKRLGIRVASFWPASAACLAIMLKIPELIEQGVLNDKGWPERQETLQLAPGMPPLHTLLLPWNNAGAPDGQHIIFQLVCRNNKFSDHAEMTVCNSFHDAEADAFKLFPNILPIGPLFADKEFQRSVGNFLPEDTSCLKWLNARPDGSVVYVAFGSMAILDPRQFQELAEGLELTGRSFLWVVRPDFTAGLSKAWLDEFKQRVAGTGMIISWCSQQQVLAHRAVACFVSHCGWNSTMEAVRNGVPVLCWPYFCEQFLDRSYVTDVWRTGLAVSPGKDGIVTKEEVRCKVETVIGDTDFMKRARLLKDNAWRCVSEGGSSHKNFTTFLELLSE